MSPYLNIAREAALNAGRILLRYADRAHTLQITDKGGNDFVSNADMEAEQAIVQRLTSAYPEHLVICEEIGQVGPADSNYQWLIDPLDGTTNFIHNFPHYAVSIGLRKDNDIIAAVVYDPIKNELFEASRGGGATLNNRKIRVGKKTSLSGALLGTGVPYSNPQDLDEYLAVLRELIKGTAGIRRAGAAALDLAYVAAGRLDGFWEFGLRVWDIAAGALLVREAGGQIGDLSGGGRHFETGDTLAANPTLFEKMRARIDECRQH